MLEGCIVFMDQAKFYGELCAWAGIRASGYLPEPSGIRTRWTHVCIGRILVHCNKGVSRSVSMVVAYLMKTQDKSFDDALAMVVAKRPVVSRTRTRVCCWLEFLRLSLLLLHAG